MPTRSDTLGASLPNLPHAISVSLPTWDDNIGYEEGDKRVVDAMVNGYPRFFIHRDIQAVGLILVFEVTFFFYPIYLSS
jgi:cystathionine gamma-synthase